MFKYLCFFVLLAPGQLVAQNSLLDKYIHEGLDKNLALQQQNLALDKSLSTRREARGLFLPSLNLEARYSRAGGGRLIEFPVGDIVNPVYSTLNELLVSAGQQPLFPTNLQNEVIPFLREEEQEARLRLVQPVFQPRVLHNYRLQKSRHRAEIAKREVFRRQLVLEIKQAYYQHLSTRQLQELLIKTRSLLEKNLRVSISLFENQKATQDVVFRAKAEISDIEQKLTEAGNGVRQTGRYLNFLINRPLDAEIDVDTEEDLQPQAVLEMADLIQKAKSQRAEYDQLHSGIGTAKHAASLAGSASLPSISFVLDYGMQGEDYNINKDSDFWMATIALQWNLFNGFQDRERKQQANLQRQALQVQLDEFDRLVRMQVLEAHDKLQAARKTIEAANDRVVSAQQSFRIVARKYAEGLAPQIEYLDARTTLTNAESNAIVAKYNFQIQYSELERVAALYPLPDSSN